MEPNPMMSHDRPMDPVGMGYGMGGMSSMTPTPPTMGMNPMMGGVGYGGVGPMQSMGAPVPSSMSGYGSLPPRPHRMPAHLSAVQMKLLTYQMKAYRCLAQSKPIPEPIRNLILSHATGISSRSVSTPPPTSSSASPAPSTTGSTDSAIPTSSLQTSSVSKPMPTPPNQLPKQTTPTTTASQGSTQPTDHSGDKTKEDGKPSDTGGGGTTGKSSSSSATHLKQVKLAPVPKPKGLDPEIIAKEREARLGGKKMTQQITHTRNTLVM